MSSVFPQTRLRRLRRTAAIRRLLDSPLPGPERFIWPVFVTEGSGVSTDIESMPGQKRRSVDLLVKETKPVIESGIGGLLVFGIPSRTEKSPAGEGAAARNGIVQRAVRALRREHGDRLVIVTDTCLCAYTLHGHCGPIDKLGHVLNDEANGSLVVQIKNIYPKGSIVRQVKTDLVSRDGKSLTKQVCNDLFGATVPCSNVHRSATVRAE